jgi:hypothetical protein
MEIFTVFLRVALYHPITKVDRGAKPDPHSNAKGDLAGWASEIWVSSVSR